MGTGWLRWRATAGVHITRLSCGKRQFQLQWKHVLCWLLLLTLVIPHYTASHDYKSKSFAKPSLPDALWGLWKGLQCPGPAAGAIVTEGDRSWQKQVSNQEHIRNVLPRLESRITRLEHTRATRCFSGATSTGPLRADGRRWRPDAESEADSNIFEASRHDIYYISLRVLHSRCVGCVWWLKMTYIILVS